MQPIEFDVNDPKAMARYRKLADAAWAGEDIDDVELDDDDELDAKHMGPGPHLSGSSQDVHAGDIREQYEVTETGVDGKQREAVIERLGMDGNDALEVSGVATLMKIDPNAKVRVHYTMAPGINVEFTGDKVKMLRSVRSDGKLLNFSLHVAKDEQGKGIGGKLLASQIDNARHKGMKKISLTATRGGPGKDVGYKVWARLGFDGPIPEHAPELPKRDTWPDEFKKHKVVSDFMKTDLGRTWWDKNGATFEGEFDLDKKSRGSIVFAKYRKKKGI